MAFLPSSRLTVHREKRTVNRPKCHARRIMTDSCQVRERCRSASRAGRQPGDTSDRPCRPDCRSTSIRSLSARARRVHGHAGARRHWRHRAQKYIWAPNDTDSLASKGGDHAPCTRQELKALPPPRRARRAPRPVARTSRPSRRTPRRPGQHRELPSSDRARAAPAASCRRFPRGSPS